MTRRGGITLLVGGLGLMLAASFWWINFRHCHCIQSVFIGLGGYADEHEGKFPSSPKGFGDALLLLVKGDSVLDSTDLVEPGDDGHVYREAMAAGADVNEGQCTRIYVQGLDNKAPGRIAILFDRDGCPGGDHFRTLWGPRVREVIFVGSGMETILNDKWPEFARKQIQLLVQNGMALSTAQSYYLMTGLTSAQLAAVSSSPPASSPRATH